jgi:hypothetical protein
MPLIEFPYIAFRIPPSAPFPNGQIAMRPFAVAVLSASTGRRLRCLVCLDSGADSCVFPARFASVLGLDMLAMPTQFTGGVGSTANLTAYTQLAVDLGRGIQFQSYVGFTPAMDAQGIGLLGQAGFFDYYNVCFYQRQLRFTVETT